MLPFPPGIRCTPGGSLKQVRVLEGMSSVFTLEGLAPGGDYVATVTVINRKGTTQPVSLDAITLEVAENRMSEYLEGVYILLSLCL